MTIDETHFYKPTLNSNRLSYEEGVKDGIQQAINTLSKEVQELIKQNKWAKANHYLKAIALIKEETNG